ncbi:MAG: 4Fe-4S dicluster domain-containing protein [Dehalococcoidia bacterium]
MDEIYKRLATKLGYADSKRLPPIFEYAASPQQARILEALNKTPDPALTAEHLSETLALDAKVIQDDLEDLFKKGLAFPRNFQDRSEWRFGKSSMQLHDAMQTGWRFFPDPERLHRLWREYDENEGYRHYSEGYASITDPLMRIVPAWESVADDSELQPCEDWREILKGVKLISVVDCPCRREVAACDRPVNVCLDFDRSAEYDIASGRGRQLTCDEALEIMSHAARSGLMSNVPNTAAVSLMCNCCSDCCVEFNTLERCGISVSDHYAKSRYEARIDQEVCSGCQDCIDNCNFDAITLVKVPGSKKLKAQVDPELCYGCGCCFVVCEPRAISMECVRPVSHVPGVA